MDKEIREELKERTVNRMEPIRRWGFWAKWGLCILFFIAYTTLGGAYRIIFMICFAFQVIMTWWTLNDYKDEYEKAIVFYKKVIGIKE